MAFTVSYQPHTNITVKDEFGDQAIYEIVEGGVLKIITPDGDKKVSYHAANVWMSVFADKNHGPGQMAQKRGSGGVW